MGPCTRRRALHGAVALLTGFAGCSGSASSSGHIGSPTATVPPESTRATQLPEHYIFRGTTSEPVVRTPSDDSNDETAERSEDRWRHRLVASTETAESLTLPDVDGSKRARAFLRETDFQTETIYVEERVVGECWRVGLCGVQWESDRIETSYSRRLRPADVACSADKEVSVAMLIRIPERLDPDEVSRFSSGSGRCEVPSSRDEQTAHTVEES